MTPSHDPTCPSSQWSGNPCNCDISNSIEETRERHRIGPAERPWTRDSYRETESALVGYFSAKVMAHKVNLPTEQLETIARECARQMRWACSEECRGMIAQRETVEQMPTDWVPIAPPDFEL